MMKTKQRGVTLVELMLAMVIGLIVMFGVGTVYSNSKKTYRVQEEFSRMQENGRFALDYIARYVRGAGYSGCASGLGNMTNTLKQNSLLKWDMDTGLVGYEAANTGPNQSVTLSNSPSYTLNTSATAWTISGGNLTDVSSNTDTYSIADHSDILVSRSADGNGVEIVKNNQSAQLFLNVTDVINDGCPGNNNDKISGICDGDILVVSDCKKSRAFQASGINVASGELNVQHSASGTPGNDPSSWGGNSGSEDEKFAPGAEIMKVSTKVFYIGQGVNGPALFVKQGDAAGQEIIDGVETLQVLYGEDTSLDNIPNHFVPASQVADFNNVVAVKVSILLASDTVAHHEAQADSYILTGHSTATGFTVNTPSDKRMRRVMSLVIKLRNRGFSL